ncbi:hypothetical protein HYQ46_011734 [Verticillium longisporum]|nr:hypothetical protein HYQ46_011734 [Verticillium longisporum]
MESHSSQCFICSIQFSTPEKLREHVWHYQTEITALFDLVRHFARHVRCDEFCTFCSTTYTQAHKYIGHKCA